MTDRMTEIPEEAVKRAALAFHNLDETGWESIGEVAQGFALKNMTRALSAAALPHLRVQETPTPAPRPVVDREALLKLVQQEQAFEIAFTTDRGIAGAQGDLVSAILAMLWTKHLPTEEDTKGATVHKPFPDDGVTYCGWHVGNGVVHEGCGEVWPCSTVRGESL